jgi:hypothetical protein
VEIWKRKGDILASMIIATVVVLPLIYLRAAPVTEAPPPPPPPPAIHIERSGKIDALVDKFLRLEAPQWSDVSDFYRSLDELIPLMPEKDKTVLSPHTNAALLMVADYVKTIKN